MKLELKSITVNMRLSEETNCYVAKLYLDGKRVANVSNHGQGAPDEVYWHDRDAETQINYPLGCAAKARGRSRGGRKKFLCQPGLDSWCADELGIYLSMKQITNLMSKKVVLLKGEEVHTLKFDPKALEVMTPQNKTWRHEIGERHCRFSLCSTAHQREK